MAFFRGNIRIVPASRNVVSLGKLPHAYYLLRGDKPFALAFTKQDAEWLLAGMPPYVGEAPPHRES